MTPKEKWIKAITMGLRTSLDTHNAMVVWRSRKLICTSIMRLQACDGVEEVALGDKSYGFPSRSGNGWVERFVNA